MNIYCLTSVFSFIHNAMGYIEINGELTFDIQPINMKGYASIKDTVEVENKVHGNNVDKSDTTVGTKIAMLKTNVARTTKAEECLYQYPDEKQVEALLSDMMNHLTKIFVRAHEYMGGRDARRGASRFKIISKKFDSRFFEQAYNEMAEEYRLSVNNTAGTSNLLSQDPCTHQPEIKQMWRNLLEHSKAILRRTAVRCVSDFLRVRNRADDARTKEKLAELLLREIREVRSNQLKVLCDEFKLCYRDLL